MKTQFEIYIYEPVSQRSVAWANAVIKRGGHTGVNDREVISGLHRLHPRGLSNLLSEHEHTLVAGATLEICLGWLVYSLVTKYEAPLVVADMRRSLSVQELKDEHCCLSTARRREIMIENRPLLDELVKIDKLRFIV